MVLSSEALRRSRSVLVLGHLLAVAAIGGLDYLSGPGYELRVLYLLPVMSAAWTGGRRLGFVIAVASTVALFIANDYPAAAAGSVGPPLWNTLSRLATYGVVTVLTTLLRDRADELRGKTAQLEREAGLREGSIALFVHELRHSAASMALASAALESSPRLDDDERSFVGRLRQQARELEQVASGLLTAGRLESGTLALDAVSLEMDALVSDAAASSAAPERLEVRTAGRHLPVRADPDHMRRAVDNYIRNALSYSTPPSRVTVEVVQQDGLAGVAVTDQGIGFDPAGAARLFRKYGRLDGRGARGGAGLGLYLTKLIVEAHGGRVEASSDGPGRGARFALYLPVATEDR